MPYYEDYDIGQKHTTRRRTITDGMATILINIGGFTVPMFNDEIEANKTPLGWRALPGRVSLALIGGLEETEGLWNPPGTGVLISINNVRWPNPLKVGDTVYAECEVIEKRKTKNPRWGRAVHKERLINQRGEVVCEAEAVHLVEYRPT